MATLSTNASGLSSLDLITSLKCSPSSWCRSGDQTSQHKNLERHSQAIACPNTEQMNSNVSFQVSEAVLAINLLIGKKNARTDKVNHMALLNIPEFATVDLFSSYADYLLGMFECLQNLPDSSLCNMQPTFEDFIVVVCCPFASRR